MLRIGIDIGGTFTDFVVHDPETNSITTYKILSDPNDPAATVLQGLERIIHGQPGQIIHGSTVATNALLERKGACTALISTHGFRDVIQIGRQNRPNLYDLKVRPTPLLVPQELRMEVDERVDHLGNVIHPLNPSQLDEIIETLTRHKVKSVAVCLLFSFLHPDHERLIAEKLRQSSYFVSISSEILPEFREYERTSTTIVNAYVSPILERYISRLETSLPNTNLQIMQSNGGMMGLPEARHNGARCILSGPAGGVVGAENIARTILSEQPGDKPNPKIQLITFDMGGTSTDVSLIDGQPRLTTDAVVGGYPIHLQLLDIHTIGAGGGSIAYVDPGGALRVGPQSAGAYPGPACYGRSELPTVTDANLVLKRLVPDQFLGGQMQIDPKRAYLALEKLGSSLNFTAEQTALGVIEVVNAQMERALRVISIERGHDPADFSLFSFGGAGGLHAVELARRMGIPKVIISKFASTLSAFGMLTPNIIKDYVKTVMLRGLSSQIGMDEFYTPLILKGITDLEAEGVMSEQIEIQRSLDVRYTGQSYELTIPYSDHLLPDFHNAHKVTYGYSYPDKPIEIVNLRVRAIGKVPQIKLPRLDSNQARKIIPSPREYLQVIFDDGPSSVPLYNYETLNPGTRMVGPALIVSADTTILINKKDALYVDQYLNLLIEVCLE